MQLIIVAAFMPYQSNTNKSKAEAYYNTIEVLKDDFTEYQNKSADYITGLKSQIQELEDQVEQKEETINGLNGEIETLEAKLPAMPSFNSSELDLFYRLVEAEAGNEPIEGRIAVANVVLNRLASDKYPDTLREVIYQPNQFEVVTIGTIDTKVPSQETIAAVNRAIAGEKAVSDDILLFWATYLDPANDLWDHCEIITTIGGHHFSNEWR